VLSNIGSDKLNFIVAVILYGVSAIYSIFLFRKGFRQDNRINYCLLLGAFGFHTAAMFLRGFTLERCPIHNLYEATTFVGWTMVLAYLCLGLWSRLRFLGAFASPVLFAVGVFALMPGLDVKSDHFVVRGGWLSLHVALFVLSYAAFGLSCVAGLMYLTQEHDLKFHKFRAVLSLMPPIQRLEIVAGRLLLGGFVLLTAALILSAIWGRQMNIQFVGDPKILWSLFVWALYFALVVMRWKFAQGGRRFAWGAVVVFIFLLLTFPLTSLLSPIHKPGP
jgi:ABC-type transport system involved in cytochrome c biogenesis permease subunit